jgi:hypothetical protein
VAQIGGLLQLLGWSKILANRHSKAQSSPILVQLARDAFPLDTSDATVGKKLNAIPVIRKVMLK